jgi:hypothetical protein
MVGDFKEAALKEEQELAKLDTLKRGLMDDLLTGRVRVAVLPSSEGLFASSRNVSPRQYRQNRSTLPTG